MARPTPRSRHALILLGCLFAVVLAAQAHALGSKKKESAPGDASNDPYAKGMDAVKQGNYEAARDFFGDANKSKKDDPDILNMLAYTQRKTGRLNDAFANYTRALEKRPNFPQAREYLGEAHLQAALESVEALKGAGPEGEQNMKALIYALQQSAAKYPTVRADELPQEAGTLKW
jgi:tetratricopeptide (TPR) repeat protein